MRKSLKVIFSSAIAMILVVAFAGMAFAADSNTYTVEDVVIDGQAVSTTESSVKITEETAAALAQESVSEITVAWQADIPSTYAGKEISFVVNGGAGKEIAFYHYNKENKWVLVDKKTADENGKVTFTLPTDLSPFALAIINDNAGSGAGAGSGSGSGSGAGAGSPQTGDFNMVIPAAALLVAALLGCGVVLRKKYND